MDNHTLAFDMADGEVAAFNPHDAVYAWEALAPSLPAAATIGEAQLYSDAYSARDVSAWVFGFLLLGALIAGNALFDWFIPQCSGDGALAFLGAGLAFRLMFSQPVLALVLAFGIGDPVIDTYGHCLMGL